VVRLPVQQKVDHEPRHVRVLLGRPVRGGQGRKSGERGHDVGAGRLLLEALPGHHEVDSRERERHDVVGAVSPAASTCGLRGLDDRAVPQERSHPRRK
jgi:hypothetical protein